MSIYFVTPGLIDLEAALTFGINAKPNTSAIGFFGTGLKYAIATLLRTGHDISVHVGNQPVKQFKIKDKGFRDKNFQIVCLDDLPLGFTTELGKQWEVWMAYRELEANTRDEEGATVTDLDDVHSNNVEQTVIQVDGDLLEMVYRTQRHQIFCSGEVLEKTSSIEVIRGSSQYLYYRGVRVHKLPAPSLFTYNLLDKQALTEDRTLIGTYMLDSMMGIYASGLTNKECLRTILTANLLTFEQKFEYPLSLFPTPEFLQAVKDCVGNMKLNLSARRLAIKHSSIREEEIKLNSIQEKQLEKALDFLIKLGFPIRDYIIATINLPIGRVGEARDGKILLSVQSFERGTKYVVETLLEEMIHLKEGVADETRAMQDALLREIVNLGEKLVGEPI